MLPLLVALACAPKPVDPAALAADALLEPAAQAGASDPVDWEREALKAHMGEHLARVNAARERIVRGELDAARVDLAWLAAHEAFPGEPAVWGGFLTAMRGQAAAAASATDAGSAGRALGAIGIECGGCHASLGVKARTPEAAEPPPSGSDRHHHASRQGWGIQRLWSAMVLPSDVAWADAMYALREPPLSVLDLGGEAALQPFAEQLGELTAAGRTFAPEDRAATYGAVVATCAGCHAAAGLR